MRIFVGITDNDWLDLLAAQASGGLDEVNFWRPSGMGFRALQPGELFLFKLHAPRNVIAGGAFFTRALRLSIRMAWETFGSKNGVRNLDEMVRRIGRLRNNGRHAALDDEITCIILSEPFFFPPGAQLPVPAEFSRNIQVGRGYESDDAVGRRLYSQVQERMAAMPIIDPGPAQFTLIETPRFGAPIIVAPRLGQGGFRIGVIEAYQRRCTMSGERTLPVLDAAHIRPFSDGGGHELRNGILLRRDLHRLFDLGYLAVEPKDQRICVSERIRAEFDNGREYYAMQGRSLARPVRANLAPDPQYLQYHYGNIYRG